MLHVDVYIITYSTHICIHYHIYDILIIFFVVNTEIRDIFPRFIQPRCAYTEALQFVQFTTSSTMHADHKLLCAVPVRAHRAWYSACACRLEDARGSQTYISTILFKNYNIIYPFDMYFALNVTILVSFFLSFSLRLAVHHL